MLRLFSHTWSIGLRVIPLDGGVKGGLCFPLRPLRSTAGASGRSGGAMRGTDLGSSSRGGDVADFGRCAGRMLFLWNDSLYIQSVDDK